MSKIETNVTKPENTFYENELEYTYLTLDSESELDSRVSDIEKFIDDNDGKGKSDEEQDTLYKNAQILWRDYATSLKNTKYNFHLNRPQWKFLTDLIITKLEYDVNSVFFAIELTDLLGIMKEIKYTNDTDLMEVKVDATEITYIYHLIAQYKVKGLTKDAYLFSQILRKIGSISKIVNYYDTLGKNLSNDIQDWVASFGEGVTVEKKKTSKKEKVQE